MVTTNFFSGPDLWPEVRRLADAAPTGTKRAAVAYVTSDRHVAFRKDDILVVDASEGAVQNRSTSPRTLLAALKAGAKIHSVEGLHAKVYVLGDQAVVGSANASTKSAGSTRIEAALITDDEAVLGEARAFVEGLALATNQLDKATLVRLAAMADASEGGDPGEVTRPVRAVVFEVNGRVSLYKQKSGPNDQAVVRPRKAFRVAISGSLKQHGLDLSQVRFGVTWRGVTEADQSFDVTDSYPVITIDDPDGALTNLILTERSRVPQPPLRQASFTLFDDGTAWLQVSY